MRSELPHDCRRSLDYASTIETLKLLEGEEVCLFISGGAGEVTSDDGAAAASRIQARGVLRHYDYGGWAEGFALGEGARVLLYEPDFVSAGLRTLDGVDLVLIGIRLANVKISIESTGAVATDEFDLFP
jgi:hypothetical protein